MTEEYSKPRARELRDALSQEIESFLKSGGDIAEVFAVLGFLLEASIDTMSNNDRNFARDSVHDKICLSNRWIVQ